MVTNMPAIGSDGFELQTPTSVSASVQRSADMFEIVDNRPGILDPV